MGDLVRHDDLVAHARQSSGGEQQPEGRIRQRAFNRPIGFLMLSSWPRYCRFDFFGGGLANARQKQLNRWNHQQCRDDRDSDVGERPTPSVN
jgi:hypothetical protein